MKFTDYTYERIEINTVQDTLNTHINSMKNAENVDYFITAHTAFNILYRHILTMKNVCSIRNSIDTTDSFYDQEQNYWDENEPYLTQIKSNHDRVLLASPLLEALKTRIPHVYFDLLEKNQRVFSDAIIDDLQLENKLVTQYNKLLSSAQISFDNQVLNLTQLGKYTQDTDRNIRKQASDASWAFFEEHEEEIDAIFDSLVKVRTKMAKTLGYPSYTEMGYDIMTRLDYNQDMVTNYRKQIVDSVVPVATKLYQRQAKRIGVDTLKYYDMNLNFLDGNAKPQGDFETTIQNGKAMYNELSSETSTFFNMMIENELLDLEAKKGKQGGGYMDFIYDLKAPFIFSNFNGTSADVDVLTHEAGHAFQGFMSKDIELPELVMPTYEACEIHSMSMEFITWPYMDKFFGDKADKYRFSHLQDSLELLPYGVQVDHFQHEVYNNPDWTPTQRKECWKSLDSLYRPHLDLTENEFADKGVWWYKQGHIFSSPFYYIDYTLAQVCAFQFWKRFNIDHDTTAWNDYLAICKVGGTQSFLEIVDTANLISPFEDGCLEGIVKDIDAWLENIDDSSL